VGAAMRASLGNEIPDTAPYTEWLALVGSIVVAVLVCVRIKSANEPHERAARESELIKA
jgi:hypothetical protein